MDRKSLICKYLYDFFLPNSCPCCKKLIKWDMLICENCEKSLPIINVKMCDKCGKKTCADHNTVEFDGAFSVMFYEGEVQKMIYALKHTGQIHNFAEYSADKLCEKLAEKGLADKIDVVTCVPMNRKKSANRGYNHAKILAKFVSVKLDKKHNYSLLLHKKDKTQQHFLHADERKSHAESVYIINPKHKDIKGKNILICDDVLTTGSTLNRCAKLLKSMGANSVYCVTIAVTDLK